MAEIAVPQVPQFGTAAGTNFTDASWKGRAGGSNAAALYDDPPGPARSLLAGLFSGYALRCQQLACLSLHSPQPLVADLAPPPCGASSVITKPTVRLGVGVVGLRIGEASPFKATHVTHLAPLSWRGFCLATPPPSAGSLRMPVGCPVLTQRTPLVSFSGGRAEPGGAETALG